ncbi:MAG: phytoene/squalene synthase family protein [Acidobacteria bacterium]|jgi:phytoene synthase|nr:phytoene/squalene synthase family protein [Acidobacteriota bacterium]
MPSSSNEIEKAYRYCETVTKTHAKSFYFAAKFLPKPKRQAVYPIYAFCRHVDDAVDDAESSSEEKVVEAIEKWKAILDEIYQIAETKDQRPKTKDQNLVLFAWQDLLETHKIPQNLPLELMQGVLMDTHTKRYETFDELYIYCYRVASTVGLMSSEILGYSDKIALRYAEALGIAMQLTNILRDMKEDAAIGRIYLPQEDLRKFGVSKEQILAGEINDNFIEMMKFQIGRARDYYRTGEKGISLLEKDSRFTVLLASRIYARILDEIERQNYDVFTRRAHTTFAQKLLSIPKIWREVKKL